MCEASDADALDLFVGDTHNTKSSLTVKLLLTGHHKSEDPIEPHTQ
jgi:hypothetical protein